MIDLRTYGTRVAYKINDGKKGEIIHYNKLENYCEPVLCYSQYGHKDGCQPKDWMIAYPPIKVNKILNGSITKIGCVFVTCEKYISILDYAKIFGVEKAIELVGYTNFIIDFFQITKEYYEGSSRDEAKMVAYIKDYLQNDSYRIKKSEGNGLLDGTLLSKRYVRYCIDTINNDLKEADEKKLLLSRINIHGHELNYMYTYINEKLIITIGYKTEERLNQIKELFVSNSLKFKYTAIGNAYKEKLVFYKERVEKIFYETLADNKAVNSISFSVDMNSIKLINFNPDLLGMNNCINYMC